MGGGGGGGMGWEERERKEVTVCKSTAETIIYLSTGSHGR